MIFLWIYLFIWGLFTVMVYFAGRGEGISLSWVLIRTFLWPWVIAVGIYHSLRERRKK